MTILILEEHVYASWSHYRRYHCCMAPLYPTVKLFLMIGGGYYLAWRYRSPLTLSTTVYNQLDRHISVPSPYINTTQAFYRHIVNKGLMRNASIIVDNDNERTRYDCGLIIGCWYNMFYGDMHHAIIRMKKVTLVREKGYMVHLLSERGFKQQQACSCS